MLVVLAAARRESRGWEQAGFVIRPERSQISGSMTALACWQQLSQGPLVRKADYLSTRKVPQ
jgi:hypothetical protein